MLPKKTREQRAVPEVEIGRRISIPGTFANVYVAARIPVPPGESVENAMARASELVDRRIPIEIRKVVGLPRSPTTG